VSCLLTNSLTVSEIGQVPLSWLGAVVWTRRTYTRVAAFYWPIRFFHRLARLSLAEVWTQPIPQLKLSNRRVLCSQLQVQIIFLL